MQILFLTDNFPPEVNAPATRTYEHCVEWKKKGAKVTVITCAPNFPKGKLFAGYQNKLWQKEEMDGIRVIRVWSYIAPNQGTFKRILDFISYAFFAFWASLFVKTDVIIATSPQFFTAVAGRLAAFFKRKPWIMEVRDLWPESIKAVDAASFPNWIISLLEKLEMHLYRSAKAVVVVTDTFKRNIYSRGIDPKKIFVVKNGVNMDRFFPVEKQNRLLKQLKLENKFVVGYLGTHGMAHKLDFILNCAKKMNGNIHFLFIGDGAEKKNLLRQKEELGLANVTMLDSVPKQDISKYIGITDLALVPLKKSDLFKSVIPSKIFENAAMRKPILLGVEGESQEIVEYYKAGMAFEPECEEDFTKKLIFLASNRTHYKALLEGCDRLAGDFDRKKLAGNMYQHILNVLEINPGPEKKVFVKEKIG